MRIVHRIVLALSSLAFSCTSTAGTNTWTEITRDGGPLYEMTYLSNTPGVALASTGFSVYRTTDNGVNWSPLIMREYPATSMTRDPSNANRAILIGSNAYSLVTEDGGLTFTQMPRFADGISDVGETTAISADGQVWYGGTGTEGQIFRSLDRGQSWERRSSGLSTSGFKTVLRIEIHPANPQHVYILRRDVGPNIYVTHDGGGSWTLLTSVCEQGCLDLSLNPHAPNELLAASRTGIYRSTDSGATWSRQDTRPAVLARFDPLVASRAIAVTEVHSIIRSLDDGQTWDAGFVLRSPLPATLAFDHLTPGRVYLPAFSGGFLSEDGGATWVERTNGIKGNGAARLVSTGVIGRTYAVGGPLGTPAIGQLDRAAGRWTALGQASIEALSHDHYAFTLGVSDDAPTVLYAGGSAGLLKSTNAGVSWTKSTTDLDDEAIRDIVVSPDDSNTIHVLASQALWTSRDAGLTFSPSAAVAPTWPKVLANDPRNAQTFYVGVVNGAAGGTLVYKTINEGSSWQPISTGIDATSIRRMKVDPDDSTIVYAATDVGVYKLTNGGEAWQRLPGTGSTEDFDIDPYETTHLIRAGQIAQRSLVERSVDGGQTWELLAEGSFGLSRTAVFDRTAPATILMANDTTIAELQIAPDLELVSSSPAIAAHSSQNVQVTLRNRGPFAATRVALIVSAPSPTTGQPSRGSCNAITGGLRCDVGTLRTDETATIAIDLPEMASGSARLEVGGRQPDPMRSNNELVLNVERRSDVGVTLTPSATSLQTGGAVDFTIAATNGDLSPGENVRVTVELPASLQWDATSPRTSASCTPNGKVLTCAVGALARFGSTQLTATARSIGSGAAIVTAAIAVDGTDPVTANNAASATINVFDPPAPPASGGSGGGGGSMGLFTLWLALMVAVRRLHTRGFASNRDHRSQ